MEALSRLEYKRINAKVEEASANIARQTDVTIADHVERWAESQPEKIFIIYQDQPVTWGEVNQRAGDFARIALANGIGPGDTVALLMENRPEFFYAWFGMLKIGACTALINTEARSGALDHAMLTVEAKLAIVGLECLDHFLSGDRLCEQYPTITVPDPSSSNYSDNAGSVATSYADALGQSQDAQYAPEIRSAVTNADTACYMFTSGTTGLPKATPVSHAKWLCVGHRVRVQNEFTADDIFYCVLPVFHGAGLMAIYSCVMAVGATSVLRRKFSVSQFWKDVAAYQITYVQYVGEICRYLLNAPPVPEEFNHTIRIMYGSGMGPALWESFVERFGSHIRIYEGWGSTESNCSTTNLDGRPGSCGRLLDGGYGQLAIVKYDVSSDTHVRGEDGFCIRVQPDEAGEAIGQVHKGDGEIVSPFVGYRDPEASAKKLIHDVFEQGDCWYRSGDLLRYDRDDYVYFVDRVGDTFRWKSENVSTIEVAQQLSGYPDAELINVYGVKVPDHEGRAGMAAVLMIEGRRFDGKAFYAHAEANLAPYARPLFVRVLKEMDLTSTLKQRKVNLQAQGYDPSSIEDDIYLIDNHAKCYTPYSEKGMESLGITPCKTVSPS